MAGALSDSSTDAFWRGALIGGLSLAAAQSALASLVLLSGRISVAIVAPEVLGDRGAALGKALWSVGSGLSFGLIAVVGGIFVGRVLGAMSDRSPLLMGIAVFAVFTVAHGIGLLLWGKAEAAQEFLFYRVASVPAVLWQAALMILTVSIGAWSLSVRNSRLGLPDEAP